MTSELKERPCKKCKKMFLPYKTKSGRITKKMCKKCISQITRENGKKSAGVKRGTYLIYQLKQRVSADENL